MNYNSLFIQPTSTTTSTDSMRTQIYPITNNSFKVGDKVTLFTPHDEMTFTVSKIYDDNYNLVAELKRNNKNNEIEY